MHFSGRFSNAALLHKILVCFSRVCGGDPIFMQVEHKKIKLQTNLSSNTLTYYHVIFPEPNNTADTLAEHDLDENIPKLISNWEYQTSSGRLAFKINPTEFVQILKTFGNSNVYFLLKSGKRITDTFLEFSNVPFNATHDDYNSDKVQITERILVEIMDPNIVIPTPKAATAFWVAHFTSLTSLTQILKNLLSTMQHNKLCEITIQPIILPILHNSPTPNVAQSNSNTSNTNGGTNANANIATATDDTMTDSTGNEPVTSQQQPLSTSTSTSTSATISPENITQYDFPSTDFFPHQPSVYISFNIQNTTSTIKLTYQCKLERSMIHSKEQYHEYVQSIPPTYRKITFSYQLSQLLIALKLDELDAPSHQPPITTLRIEENSLTAHILDRYNRTSRVCRLLRTRDGTL